LRISPQVEVEKGGREVVLYIGGRFSTIQERGTQIMLRKFIAALVAAAIMALMVGPVAYAQEAENNNETNQGAVIAQGQGSEQTNSRNTATAVGGGATASNDNLSSQTQAAQIKQKNKTKQVAVAVD
jgi:hypothetical protein